MSIIREYTSNYVKANRKSGVALFLSITAAVVLINAYVFFVYSILMDSFKAIKKINHWDAQTYEIPMDKAGIVEQNQNVKSISLEEPAYCGKLKGNNSDNYIFIRSGDKRFWDEFSPDEFITEGRLPQIPNEIIVNNLFLSQNPNLKIGDTIRMSLGKRMYKDNELLAFDSPISGEEFIEEKEVSFKICGSFLNFPGINQRASMGFYLFNPASLKKDARVSVNIFLTSKLNAYKKLFEITESLGFDRNKDGSYKIFINTPLLDMYGIKDPLRKGRSEMESLILKFLIGLIILTLIFVYLIYNIFEVWAAKRIKQIAMLKSIGADKGHIFHSILLEAVLLSIPPILTGVFAGIGFNVFLFKQINRIANSAMAENTDIFSMPQYEFGILPVILVILFSFITVLIASLIPAARLSKINIIDSLKGNIEKSKKHKRKVFADGAWEKENRKNNFRTFRGTSNAIFISYVLLFTLLTLITVNFIREDHKYYESKDEIKVGYCLVNEDEQFNCSAKNIFYPIQNLKECLSSYYYVSLDSWFICSDENVSAQFKEESWFEQKHQGRYFWKEGKNKKLNAKIYGLDNETFKKVLASIGEDEASYYAEDSYKAILVNRVQKDWRIPYRNSQFIPLLDSNIKEINCSLQKKLKSSTEDEKKNSFKTLFPIIIGKTINDTDLIETKAPLYSVLLILPIEKAERLRNAQIAFDKENAEFFRDGLLYSLFLKTEKESIVPLRKTIENIMKPALRGENMYWQSDIFIEKLSAESSNNFFKAVFFSFLLLVLLAGCINSYSAIMLNLRTRKNEFALFKSVGADSNIITNLFYKEAGGFLIKPLLKAIPFFLAFAAILIIRFDEVFVLNFLLSFNWGFFIFYSFCLSASIISSYYFGKKEIEDGGIISGIDGF
ncbi:ABC transporter permease [Treponema sp. OMZ 792]|uniref:ABC transporter permease n=1 Tax=unclassified Treponema TaxID=2638727 RepID=UPI0020A4693C|nr:MULTISPECIES: ABC transporter permease [unclassified Treponema]UTC74836.1 ABC transporter permease [Treponema sp. OMZ 792]UTC81230.1 ABC transporter permease [Treponema sp. OMZ 798]